MRKFICPLVPMHVYLKMFTGLQTHSSKVLIKLASVHSEGTRPHCSVCASFLPKDLLGSAYWIAHLCSVLCELTPVWTHTHRPHADIASSAWTLGRLRNWRVRLCACMLKVPLKSLCTVVALTPQQNSWSYIIMGTC